MERPKVFSRMKLESGAGSFLGCAKGQSRVCPTIIGRCRSKVNPDFRVKTKLSLSAAVAKMEAHD